MKHFNFFFFTQLKISHLLFHQDWIPKFHLRYLTFTIIIECVFRTIWITVVWIRHKVTNIILKKIFYVKHVSREKKLHMYCDSPFILYNFNNHTKSKPDEMRTVIHYFRLPSSWNKVKFTKRTRYRGTAQFSCSQCSTFSKTFQC